MATTLLLDTKLLNINEYAHSTYSYLSCVCYNRPYICEMITISLLLLFGLPIFIFSNVFLSLSWLVCFLLNVNSSYPFYVALFFILCILMLVTLTLLLLCYFYYGYTVSFTLYMSIYGLSLPIFLVMIYICYVVDFSTDYQSGLKFNFLNLQFALIGFKLDNLSVTFAATTLVIGFFTGYFQYFYMSDDTKKDRFFFFLNYFVFSMVGFVLSNNFMLLLFFWEFLGITSFFLIAHYDTRFNTLKSALKAFTFNRSSDVFLMLAVAIHFNTFGDFNLHCGYTGLADNCKFSFSVALLIVLASFVKSAQSIFFF